MRRRCGRLGVVAVLLGAALTGCISVSDGEDAAMTVSPGMLYSPKDTSARDLPRGTFGVPAAQVDPRALIPLGRIRGPILMACGPLDTQWQACRNIDDALARLGRRPGVTVARYPGAGHYVSAIQPYTAVTDALLTRSGGTVPATLAANVDLHRRILALLAAQ